MANSKVSAFIFLIESSHGTIAFETGVFISGKKWESEQQFKS